MPELISLRIILIGIYAGLSAACIVAAVVHNSVSKVVNRILKEGATDKSTAKTAEELRLGSLGKRILRGQLYGKLIRCSNEYYVRTDRDLPAEKRNPYKNPPLDMNEARFYIPEELRYRAEVRYPGKRIPVIGVIAAVLVLAVAFAVLYFALPGLISMFRASIT